MSRRATRMTIHGLKPLLKRLEVLPERVQRRVLRKAVTAGAQVVVKAAKKTAPRDTGTLRRSIIKTRAKFYRNSGAIVVMVGPKSRAAPHHHLVEHGTRPRDGHPGTQATRFLQSATEGSRDASRAKIEQKIRAELPKEIAKLKNMGGRK